MSRQPTSAHDGGFTAEVYRIAAQEHVTSLTRLYEMRAYVLALYVAGLAVESIFRAYRFRIAPEFDSRHDLRELFKASRFAEAIPARRMDDYGAALSAIVVRWSNRHRYRSESAMRSYLKKAGLHRGMRGDFLKENVRRAITAATELVTLGVTRWTGSSKS